jgi:Methyltransferase FkbM domain
MVTLTSPRTRVRLSGVRAILVCSQEYLRAGKKVTYAYLIYRFRPFCALSFSTAFAAAPFMRPRLPGRGSRQVRTARRSRKAPAPSGRPMVSAARTGAIALSNEMGNAFFSNHLGSNAGFLSSSTEILQNSQCVVVPTFRLNQVTQKQVDLVKLDVEDAEGLVVEAGWSTISKDRPIVMSEFSPEMLGRVSKVRPLD